VTLAKERAADAMALIELTPPLPQSVMTAEDPFGPNVTVEALYESMPDTKFLSELIGEDVVAAILPDQDWIKASLEGLPPVRAGRFFLYGAHSGANVPHGVIPIHIEAGLAFGTGHHETTALCLAALSQIARRRRHRNVLDLGCGTGVLAIAAAKLWRQQILATDIDPVAIEVTHENARLNGVAPFVCAAVAEGMDHPFIRAAAPFDLVLANILSGPLTRLAPGMAAALAPRGIAVLSGLLRWQEDQVLSFYRAQGLVLRRICRQSAWSALVLERP
jgi:ribosomal protein L11 methyltransferase